MFKHIEVDAVEAWLIDGALSCMVRGTIKRPFPGKTIKQSKDYIVALRDKYRMIHEMLSLYQDKEHDPRYAGFKDKA